MNPTRFRSRSRPVVCWLSLGGLVVLVTFLFINVNESTVEAQPPSSQPEPTVQIAAPKRQSVRRELILPGILKASEEVAIQSKIAGYVEKLNVDIGDKVKKGDVLAKLWVPELEEQLKVKSLRIVQREAELKQAKLAVTVAEAVLEVSEAQRNEAVAALSRAEAQYNRWDSEAKREKELVDKGVLDKKALDESLHQLNAAAAAVNEVKAKVATFQGTLKLNRANKDKAATDVEIAQAGLDVAKAEYQEQKVWMDYAQLRAPFDGVVTRRNINTGHFVQPANSGVARKDADALLVITRQDLLKAVLQVPENDAVFVKDGAEAIVRLPALDNREIKCKVTRTAWALDNERCFLVEIAIDNSKHELLPGMYGNVTILAGASESMTLPVEAVLTDGTAKYCFLVENGKATRRNVRVGRTDKGVVEVLAKQLPATKPGDEGTWVKFTGEERAILVDLNSIEQGKSMKK